MSKRYARNDDLNAFARKVALGIATDEDCAAVGIAEVKAIKTDGEIHRYAAVPLPVEKADASSAAAGRWFTASTEKADRCGDVVRVAGWEFVDFDKNPVVLAYHNYNGEAFPIGSVTAKSTGLVDGYKSLREQISLSRANPLGAIADAMIDEGSLSGCSVGFRPLEAYWPETPEERVQLGVGQYGVEYRRQSQLELSLCAIPMHPDAIVDKSASIERLIASGKVDPDSGRDFIKALRRSRKSWASFAEPARKPRQMLVRALTEEQGELLDELLASQKTLTAKLDALTAEVVTMRAHGDKRHAELLASIPKNTPTAVRGPEGAGDDRSFYERLADVADGAWRAKTPSNSAANRN